jgi:S-DNA-T family DNA segregation ATPase FtsK/SpoIIIE
MATTKNKFREKPVDDTVVQQSSIDKNDIEETVLSSSKNKSKSPKTDNVKSTKTKVESKSSVNETKASLLERWNKTVSIYKNERTQKLVGLLLMLAGVYLFIALLSYIFTWEKDQDKVLGPLSELFAIDTKVFNWLGKFGALVSHQFMYKWFGVASFILVPVFIIYGLQKVLNKQITKPSAFTAKWLFFMVWTSLVLAFFFHDKLFFLGGGYGYVLNIQLSNYVGSVGTLAVLAFSMLAFLVLSFNMNFNIKKDVIPSLENEAIIEDELKEDTNTINPHANTVFEKEPTLSKEEEEALLNFEVISTNEEIKEEPIAEPVEENIPLELEVTPKPEEPKKDLDFEINNPGADEVLKEPEFVKEEPKENQITLDDELKASQLVEKFGQYDPTLDLGHYQFPSTDLLIDYGTGNAKVSNEELTANKDRIVSTLKNYGIEIDSISAIVGPTVTLIRNCSCCWCSYF